MCTPTPIIITDRSCSIRLRFAQFKSERRLDMILLVLSQQIIRETTVNSTNSVQKALQETQLETASVVEHKPKAT